MSALSEQNEQMTLDDELETWEQFIARMNDPEHNPQIRRVAYDTPSATGSPSPNHPTLEGDR